MIRNVGRRACVRGVLALATVTAITMTMGTGLAHGAAPMPVRVLLSGGYMTAIRQVMPDLQQATNTTIITGTGASQGTGQNTIGAQLARGIQADIVILTREGLDELIREGRIVPGSDVNLAETPVGYAVRKGAPKPDIHDVTAFKRALTVAKSIVLPGSTSGIYMRNDMMPKLGIAADKYHSVDRGAQATDELAAGKVEVALLPVSEILHVEGVELVGPIPKDVQFQTRFSAAIVKNAADAAAARRVVAYLDSDKPNEAVEYTGMVRSKPVR